MYLPTTESIAPNDQETQMARVSSAALAPLLDNPSANEAHFHLRTQEDHSAEITLPASAVRVLFQALQEMAKGNAVTVLSTDAELTVQQAADILRMPPRSVNKLLDEEKLPSRQVGLHRRVRSEDVLQYLKREHDRRTNVMKELVAETERLGLY